MSSDTDRRPAVSLPVLDEEEAAGGSKAGAYGQLFITRKCCGAANCRNFAPELFGEVTTDGGGAAQVMEGSYEPGAFTGVIRHPATLEEYRAARAAVAGCGFAAIKLSPPTAEIPPEDRGSPWKRFPLEVEDGVWLLGQPGTKNYGALAYFIERDEGGVLVDLPRPSEELFAWLEAHGGVKWIFLSHRDHVQHHAEYAARFPEARRVIGAGDVNKYQSQWADATVDVEVKIPEAVTPHTLDGEAISLEELSRAELAVLPQPGHTPGGLCLLYRGRFLFTGDHLAYSRARGHLTAHRLQCWQDWSRLTASVETLAEWAAAGHLSFSWVLPGHGEWMRPDDLGDDDTSAALSRAVEWMKAQPAGNVPLIRWIPFVQARAKPDGRFGRAVRWLGAGMGEAWLIPAPARTYLTDFDPGQRASASRRHLGLSMGALTMAAALAWWFTSAV